MSIQVTDLRNLIIRPTLERLNDWSLSAENLLLGTAALESTLGYRLTSDNGGLGIYAISPAAHIQVWDHFLVSDPETASLLRGLASQQQFLKCPHGELISNLSYASGVAWMIYKSHHVKLPDNTGIRDLAIAWLGCYSVRNNQVDQISFSDDAKIDKFMHHYRNLVLCENKNLAA